MKQLIGYQRGVNLGGWLSQGNLEKQHLDTFITEQDIEKIASWNVDHIRLPIDFEIIETADGTPIEAGYHYIDQCIFWCRKHGLNVVLDLHKTCGYIFDDAEYSSDFFTSQELQDRFINLWDKLSARYAKDADMLMFEMLNEVTRLDVVDEWNAIALRCIETIRHNAPTVKILFGGVGFSAITAVKDIAMPVDENIIYNFHCYEPLIFTHQSAYWVDGMKPDFHIAYPWDPETYDKETRKVPGALTGVFANENNHITKLGPDFFKELFSEAVKVAEERNVALYCGEYGVIDQAPTEDTVRWFADIHAAFEAFGIGRACWSYKEMDFGITDAHYNDVLEEIIHLL